MFPLQIEDIDKSKYISSIGCMKACDDNDVIKYIDPFVLNIDWERFCRQGKDGSAIYVKFEHLHNFVHVFNYINFRFVLVTGDGDHTFPHDLISYDIFETLINSDKIIHWYSINCDETIHPKLSIIPIGVNYHCDALWKNISVPTQEASYEKIRASSLPFHERIPKCYSNFHFNLNEKFGNPRKMAIEKIPENLVHYEPNKVSIEETWINQSRYSFVISPHGNGLDCHRTWEALILGCIVIVKKSILDPLYKDLPVLIVDDWSDITEELLSDTLGKFMSKKYNYDKITLKYWVDKIHA